MKRHMIADDLLIDLLDSDNFREINGFPYEVNENIIVFRQGNVARWGKLVGNADDSLSIASKMRGHIDSGNVTERAFVGELPEHPGVFFIRCGTKWIWAFHESGALLSWARRFQAIPRQNRVERRVSRKCRPRSFCIRLQSTRAI